MFPPYDKLCVKKYYAAQKCHQILSRTTQIAVAPIYLTTCKSARSHSEAIYEGFATRYLAEIRQVICQTTEGLRVREPKNGNERIAPLGAKATPKSLRGLRALVKERKGQAEYVPLFCSNRGTAVSYAAVQYQWAQLCTALGLVDEQGGQHHLRYTIHQLRHTRGSELVRHGQPMEIVQRVLGHRDIRSTQGYAALDDVQVREALERGGQA